MNSSQTNRIRFIDQQGAIMNILGIMLITIMLMIFSCIIYSFLFDNLVIIHAVHQSYLLDSILFSIMMWLAFNSLFNFVLAVLVSPGYTAQFFKAQNIQLDDRQTLQQNSVGPGQESFFYQDKQNLRQIKLDNRTLSYCDLCRLPKPPRCHHCTICNKCVLKMDHHCPWINGCVGYNNHAYFLLYLLYTWAGVLFISITSIPILISHVYDPYKNLQTQLFQIILPLDYVLSIVLGMFVWWNWHLAYKGFTSIEFWGRKLPNSNNQRYDYSSEDFLDNYRQIFGNFKYLPQIFLPQIKRMMSNGVLWDEILTVYDEEDIQYQA